MNIGTYHLDQIVDFMIANFRSPQSLAQYAV